MQKVEHIGLKPVGEPGPTLLISGRWNVNKDYIRDSEVIPLVEHEGLFYSLNKVGIFKGGLTPKDDYAKYGAKATWKLQNSYEMIIVKAIVADGGLLGDFVFWGGKMFSKQGTDKQGNFSDRYTEYPSGNFIPNYSVDAITGEIISLKGKFGLLEIVGNTLVGKSLSGEELIRITGEEIPDESKFTPDYEVDLSVKTISERSTESLNIDFENGRIERAIRELDFNLDLKEIGEYRLDECALNTHTIKFNDRGENLINGFSIKSYVKCTITQNGKTIHNKEYTYVDTQDGVSPEFYIDKVGTVNIKLLFTTMYEYRDGDYMAYIDTSVRGLSHKSTPRKSTCIGSDGLYTSFSTQEYLHYKSGQGFTIRAGGYGLKVTKEGVKKWNGSKWIAANI